MRSDLCGGALDQRAAATGCIQHPHHVNRQRRAPRDLLMSGSTLVIAHVLVKEPNNSDVLGMAFEDLRMGRRSRARAYVLAENACWRSLNSGDATKRGAQCRNAVRTLAKVASASNVGAAAPEIDLSRNRACLTPHEADAA